MKRPSRPSTFALLVALATASLGMAGYSCKRTHAAVTTNTDGPLPTVRADTDSFLLTWIDDKGDFHVETRVADVPMTGRDAVRVVDPNRDENNQGDRIVVVDLREPRPDGTYPVRTMSRVDFEALAVARREKTGPTMASAAPAEPSPSGSQPSPPETPSATRPAAHGAVVIYGAEWCGACHEAARYLRRKGIPYVEKDVEKDSGAAREMQAKLSKSGLRAGSIPVIDVRGRIMVGFNPADIDAALGDPL
jgi:glutaredoxin